MLNDLGFFFSLQNHKHQLSRYFNLTLSKDQKPKPKQGKNHFRPQLRWRKGKKKNHLLD